MTKKDSSAFGTFGQLFKLSVLTILPVALYTFVLMFSKIEKNNRILSLFLMLLYAFIYVIFLYIVFAKMNVFFETPQELLEKGIKQRPICATALIYVTRFAVRIVILLYVFVRGCKILMLPEYNDYVILIPMILLLLFLTCKGVRGYVCFLEVVFWFVSLVFILLSICTFHNLDLSRLSDLYSFGIEQSLSYTIGTIMSRGYIYLLPFVMLEIVIAFYMKVKDRTRVMLAVSVGIPGILSIFVSVLVTNILGVLSLNINEKNILNIVGALEYPGGGATRMGLLVCSLFVIFSIAVIGAHFVYTFSLMKRWKKFHVSENLWWVIGYGIGILVLYILFDLFISDRDVYGIVATYFAIIDIPLSVIVPAFVGRGKTKPGKYVAGIIGCVLLFLLVTGCSYKPMEDVDYLRIVIIEDEQYTLVIDSLDGENETGSTTKESIFESYKQHLQDAIDAYDAVHAKSLDISHVEYLVMPDQNALESCYSELIQAFATNYIQVIYASDILEKTGEENIRDYISSHYQGKTLASIDLGIQDEKVGVRLYLE